MARAARTLFEGLFQKARLDDYTAKVGITDIAAGAATVFDQHRLLPVGAHLVGDGTRCNVGGTPRREGHDDADRFGGVGLGLRQHRMRCAQYACPCGTSDGECLRSSR